MALGRIAYGMVFVVFVPALLYMWEWLSRPMVDMPVYGGPWLAGIIAAVGAPLMVVGMWQLWKRGGGLPMNAYPPPRLVTNGIYGWLPDPIYTGFTLLCWALSIYTSSPSGLWLITPSVALGCFALIVGYEWPDLERRFGVEFHAAHFVLPPDDPRRALWRERIRVLFTVLIPWSILYEVTARLAPRIHTLRVAFPGEDSLPAIPWTELLYASAYPVLALTPLVLRRASEVRRFAIQGWVAMALLFSVFLCVPINALPSFHVLWAVLAAEALAANRPRWRWPARIWAALVALGCATGAVHGIPGIIAAWVLAPFILGYPRGWEVIRRAAEWVANSWREWRFGPVRIINHGFYAGLGTFVALCIITAATGPGLAGPILITVLGGIAGAGLWAQLVEGSPRLLRPFGFYGGLLGVIATCTLFPQVWLLWAAQSLAGPWLQSLGRLRCLVQGCCHGAPASPGVGIVYRRPESRVVRLAHLEGVSVHATQLYSILWNTLTGMVLLRLWICEAPLNVICAAWLILNGLGRFVEERYRGEPQTRILAGLRFYQWLAIASVLGGIAVSCVPGVANAPPLELMHINLPLALAGFVITSFALGVDFPGSNSRFARLT